MNLALILTAYELKELKEIGLGWLSNVLFL
jgi:hypothetical protein